MVKAAVALALVAIASCTYGASFDDCRVSACQSSSDCPSGFTCDGEDFCRAPGATAACATVLVDGSVDARPTDGGGQARCTGTVTACSTFMMNPSCVAQTGCGWVAPTCTVKTNCAMYMTNQECTSHAECFTDFTSSTCARRGDYCSGTSKSQCEANTKCMFGGGCSGTADACSAFTSLASCNAQGGCSWH